MTHPASPVPGCHAPIPHMTYGKSSQKSIFDGTHRGTVADESVLFWAVRSRSDAGGRGCASPDKVVEGIERCVVCRHLDHRKARNMVWPQVSIANTPGDDNSVYRVRALALDLVTAHERRGNRPKTSPSQAQVKPKSRLHGTGTPCRRCCSCTAPRTSTGSSTPAGPTGAARSQT